LDFLNLEYQKKGIFENKIPIKKNNKIIISIITYGRNLISLIYDNEVEVFEKK
jgi:hypothetical protein